MERPLQTTTQYMIKLTKQPNFYDYGTLLEFYQPIIGPIACSLYMTLFNNIKNNINLEMRNDHSRLFATTQLNKNDFVKEIKMLESISLVKTYYKKVSKELMYIYELLPPMSHEELFDNKLFMEVINIKLDKNDIKYLNVKWNSKFDDKKAIDISEKFNSSNNFIIPSNQTIINTREISIEFNEDLLKGFLEQYNINYENFNIEEKNNIKVLFAAYGVEYYKFASLINKVVTDGKLNLSKLRNFVQKEYNDRLNNNELNLIYTKDVSTVIEENSKLSKKINSMSSITPNKFLEERLKRKPLTNELKMIETIMATYKLSTTTMNILIDFSLFKNSKLVFPYIEKIAKTLKDKNYKNPVDIIAYLIEADKISKAKKVGKIINNKKQIKLSKNVVKEINDVTDEELDVIWEGFIDE